MLKNKTKIILVVSFLLFFVGSNFAQAFPGVPLVPCGRTGTPDCNECHLFELADNILKFIAFGLIPIVAVLLFVVAGFLILLGGARPDMYSKGVGIFKTTFFGMLVIYSSWLVANTVIQALGVKQAPGGSWWEYTCTPSAPLPPPTTGLKFSCDSNTFACTANQNGSFNDQASCDAACQPPAGTIAITTLSLPAAVLNQSYTSTVQAKGGIAPYTWSITSAQLTGVTISSAGVISVKPAKLGTFSVTVKVTDSKGLSDTQALDLVVSATVSGVCPTTQSACATSLCSQYAAAINQYASGVVTANLLKAIMFHESGCDIKKTRYEPSLDDTSAGLMQILTRTANSSILKRDCGLNGVSIDVPWLTNPANAAKSICLAAKYLQGLSGGACASNVRHLAAGYNGGPKACTLSTSCAGPGCDNSQVRQWECTSVPNNYGYTRAYVPKVLYCSQNPGF